MQLNPFRSSLVLLAGVLAGVALAAEPVATAPPRQVQLEQQLEAARERLDTAAREVGELSAELGRDVQGRMQRRLAGRAGAPGVPGPGRWGAERLRGMELATLSERLGSYFGVTAGVLVVRAGRSDALALQDGDVILSIDGRTPENAGHALRILGSYRGGEKFVLRVQRDRRAQDIQVMLPERPARPARPARR